MFRCGYSEYFAPLWHGFLVSKGAKKHKQHDVTSNCDILLLLNLSIRMTYKEVINAVYSEALIVSTLLDGAEAD